MNSKQEMKKVRDFLRNQVKLINADPYLEYAHNRVSARIVRWNERSHEVLVCVRDLETPETLWDSQSCRWLLLRTGSAFWKSDLWRALNSVVCNMRLLKKS